jgi:hypothetical protein
MKKERWILDKLNEYQECNIDYSFPYVDTGSSARLIFKFQNIWRVILTINFSFCTVFVIQSVSYDS